MPDETLIEIRIFKGKNKQEPYLKWLKTIKDPSTKARIQYRLRRMEVEDNFGDARSLGQGVYELKFHFGPGYRIYFGSAGRYIVILLCGGDKKSQEADIKTAKALWKEYKEMEDASIKEI